MVAACLFLCGGDEMSVGGWSSFYEKKKSSLSHGRQLSLCAYRSL